MLIDASHPEETRVAVVKGNRIEEFDFESQHRKQLKGNIYLARVTRVEPSLQAAFVEYGGNRHGFLAFSEIHPDYYQIPVADRQALLQADAEAVREELDEDDAEAERAAGRNRSRRRRGKRKSETKIAEGTGTGEEPSNTRPPEFVNMDHLLSEDDLSLLTALAEETEDTNGDENGNGEEDGVESVGAEDALEELPSRRRSSRRNYKIQEVIKRRQILLVQVVKEERGNKGAALTTYMSLAGRYSVLMPNTARGGGISRKITSAPDRRRLKDIVKDLDVPQGMGVILRTAGANRTKPEVKRDYEYLMRLWDNVRNLTLKSTAPCLVYEEGSLIKRSVRDLYNKDIDEILVAGEEGYREAKDFMRMLMPSHAKCVQPYRQATPLFARYGIEGQLDRMLQPQVTLKSGGYIIINQTEALVAIDVNSGRSTREHSIEDTAYQTNLEAADEVARQLRLRDLAGLIVIDFIDMEEKRNNRNVEKRLKDALKFDRARIQVGHISHFGLMEMSRQRIRASVLESTMSPCPHCNGTGYIRSESSVALHVMRTIEEYLIADSKNNITVRTPAATALYVLNHKRQLLGELETRFGLQITIEADDEVGAQHVVISKGSAAPEPGTGIADIAYLDEPEDADEAAEATDIAEVPSEETQRENGDDDGDGKGKRRRRRRRRRGGRDREDASAQADAETGTEASVTDEETVPQDGAENSGDASEDGERKKRRRGRRGGRRNKRDGEVSAAAGEDTDRNAETDEVSASKSGESAEVAQAAGTDAPKPAPKRGRRTRKSKGEDVTVTSADNASSEGQVSGKELQTEKAMIEKAPDDEKEAEPVKRRGRTRAKSEKEAPDSAAEQEKPAEPVVTSIAPENADEEPAAPRRGGWWQRKGFF